MVKLDYATQVQTILERHKMTKLYEKLKGLEKRDLLEGMILSLKHWK